MRNINIQKINSENIYNDNLELTLDNLILEWSKKFTDYVHLERNKIRESKNDLKNQLILNSRQWLSEIKQDINTNQEELKKNLFIILESSKKEIFITNLNNWNFINLPNLNDIILWIKWKSKINKWWTKLIKNEDKLEWWKDKFDKKYGLFTKELWTQLWLPKNLIESIIYRETSFWKNLDNKWWSRWMMQLTSAPFYDMMWYHDWKIWINQDREKMYRDIFWDLDINKLQKTEEIKNEIPEEIWDDLKWLSLNDFRDSKRYIKTIKKLKKLLKDKNWPYYNTLNMIVWSVYLKFLYNSDNWKWNEFQKIKRVSKKYNWNDDLINWRKIKDLYWDAVSNYWKKMWNN